MLKPFEALKMGVFLCEKMEKYHTIKFTYLIKYGIIK